MEERGCKDERVYLLLRYCKEEINDATQEHIISYCGSCRGSMELGGLDSLHILQLIHGKCYYKKDVKKRSDNYGLHNRLEAKRRVSK